MHQLTRRIFSAAAISAVIVVTGGAIPAQASPTAPPSLVGELLNDTQSSGLQGMTNCGFNGAGTFSWTSTGTASGNYNGTYTQNGSATSDSSGNVTLVSLISTITTPDYTVTVVEQLLPDGSSSGGCLTGYPYGGTSGPIGAWQAQLRGNVRYTATIAPTDHTPATTVTGNGTYFVLVDGMNNTFDDQDATTPALAATSTSLTSPMVSALQGQPVTFFAKVAETGGTAVPTGTVTFSSDGTPVQTVAMDSTGGASFTDSVLGVGSHAVTAAYNGDTANASSVSSAFAETVNAPTPSKLVQLTGQYLTSSARFAALPPQLKNFVTGAITIVSTQLARITTLTPAQKRVLVPAFQRAVNGLVAGNWLTSDEGVTLNGVAADL